MNKWVKLGAIVLAMLMTVGCAAAATQVESAPAAVESSIVETETAEEESSEEVEEVAVEESVECSVEEVEESSEEEEIVVEEEPALPVVGKQSGSETEFSVTLMNSTQGTITGIEIITPDGEEWTGQMVEEGLSFAPGDSFILVFDPAAAAGDTDYNVILYFSDGGEHRLHAFPFGDTDAVEIKATSVVFIEYLSAKKGEVVSSENSELAISWSKQGGGDDPNAGCITDAPTN